WGQSCPAWQYCWLSNGQHARSTSTLPGIQPAAQTEPGDAAVRARDEIRAFEGRLAVGVQADDIVVAVEGQGELLRADLVDEPRPEPAIGRTDLDPGLRGLARGGIHLLRPVQALVRRELGGGQRPRDRRRGAEAGDQAQRAVVVE